MDDQALLSNAATPVNQVEQYQSRQYALPLVLARLVGSADASKWTVLHLPLLKYGPNCHRDSESLIDQKELDHQRGDDRLPLDTQPPRLNTKSELKKVYLL